MNFNTHQVNRAFTLVELIVVMVVMTILAGISTMAYRGIAEDLRMSSAMNSVVAALDNARAMAIKKNRYVMTVFRPRLVDDNTRQVVDIVIAEWNGDSASADRGDGDIWTYDRFIPIQGLQVRTLSGGVNVAGPAYGLGRDYIWLVSTYLPSSNEPFGALIGVLYNPEGRVVVRNAESGADRIWVDFNGDWTQTINATTEIVWNDPDVVSDPWSDQATPNIGSYFDLEIPDGEPFVSMTPILSVFNETEFRKQYGTGQTIELIDWTVEDPPWHNNSYCFQLGITSVLDCEIPCCTDGQLDEYDRNWMYSRFIELHADRIQFNRYSGVPLK